MSDCFVSELAPDCLSSTTVNLPVTIHDGGIDWARFPIMCLEKVQQAFLRKKRLTTFSRGLFRADYE